MRRHGKRDPPWHAPLFLIINTYSPTDQQTTLEDWAELETCLSTINNIMGSSQFNHLVLLGDLNFDTSRDSSHANLIKEFFLRKNMFSAWRNFPVDFTYSFEAENRAAVFKVLDHMVFLERSKSLIKDAGVIRLVENQSDHEVIYSVVLVATQETFDDKNPPESFQQKPSWKKASKDQKLDYNDNLFRKLLHLEPPERVNCCNDLKCNWS